VLIETDRLRLRPVTMDDLDDLAALHAEPGVERFMGQFDRPRSRLLGGTGLKHWPEFSETEVGWVLHPDAWGQGFATEGARACVRWGFENLSVPYLTAMIRPDNARSIAVAEQLGMTPGRRDTLLGEAVIVYLITREAWANDRSR
jgi:RimJ/RimL family protein N-acetyltransferase